MKILITTTKKSDTIASYYTKYLSLDKRIQLFKAYTFDLEDEYIASGFLQKINAHYLPFFLTEKVSAHLDSLVNEYEPNVLLIIQGQFISASVLEKIKKKGVFLINYNPDHPIYFETRTPGDTNLKRSLRQYDLVFTYSPIIENDIKKYLPGLHTAILPFGYEKSRYNSNELNIDKMMRKICFAGTADNNRCEFIKELIKSKIHVDLYGRGYRKYFKQDTAYLNIYPAVHGDDYLNILQNYSIALNLYRKQNIGGHNMRSFEIPSVGGMQLVEYSDQMENFFINHEEIFLYRDKSELHSVIGEVLHYSDAEVLAAKKKIRMKTMNAHYSYKDRASEMISKINAVI